METRKLYYEDCHLSRFTATVCACSRAQPKRHKSVSTASIAARMRFILLPPFCGNFFITIAQLFRMRNPLNFIDFSLRYGII